ncbi:MAG: acyltransferase family protein [Selenomonadaceae bacterium]|nr:acyltransferase family protein [Selenomonadaceae bacterium]
MLTVIYGHAAVYNHEKFFDVTLTAVYVFHMPFFFIMAGYLLDLSKWGGAENFKKFATKLFKRLLVPYYLAEILWYPIWFSAGHVMGHEAYIRNEALSPVNALLGIFVGNGNLLALVPLWFLPALFFAELIYLKLHNRLAKVPPEIFLLIILALSYLGYLIGKIVFLPMGLDVALTVQGFLLAGVLIRKYNVIERLTRRHCLILLNVFALVLLFNGKISMNARDYGDLFLLYLGGISGTLLVMKFSVWMTKIGGKFCALIKYCGQQSLFVMTAHLIIAFAVYDLVVNTTDLPVKLVRSLPEVIFAITLLGLLIPLFIAKKFGRLPVLKIFCP